MAHFLFSGSKGETCQLEDARPTCLPFDLANHVVDPILTGCHFECPDLHPGLRHFAKESQRFVELSLVLVNLLIVSTEALAGSTVKIAGRDVLATWKVLISLGVAPILYASYAVIAIVVALKANFPFGWIMWIPILAGAVLPIMSYAALKFGEAGMDILK